MAETPDRILQQLATLRLRYGAALPDKIAQIRAGFDALRECWDVEGVRTLHRQAHSLAGSGATFGFAEVSQAARTMELRLKVFIESGHAAVAEDWLAWAQQLADLEGASRTATPASTPAPTPIYTRRPHQSSDCCLWWTTIPIRRTNNVCNMSCMATGCVNFMDSMA